MNQYLDSFMKGLTAKVFRTYNASVTLQNLLKRLNKSTKIYRLPMKETVLYPNRNDIVNNFWVYFSLFQVFLTFFVSFTACRKKKI